MEKDLNVQCKSRKYSIILNREDKKSNWTRMFNKAMFIVVESENMTNHSRCTEEYCAVAGKSPHALLLKYPVVH